MRAVSYRALIMAAKRSSPASGSLAFALKFSVVAYVVEISGLSCMWTVAIVGSAASPKLLIREIKTWKWKNHGAVTDLQRNGSNLCISTDAGTFIAPPVALVYDRYHEEKLARATPCFLFAKPRTEYTSVEVFGECVDREHAETVSDAYQAFTNQHSQSTRSVSSTRHQADSVHASFGFAVCVCHFRVCAYRSALLLLI